jgi:hypothetical protein
MEAGSTGGGRAIREMLIVMMMSFVTALLILVGKESVAKSELRQQTNGDANDADDLSDLDCEWKIAKEALASPSAGKGAASTAGKAGTAARGPKIPAQKRPASPFHGSASVPLPPTASLVFIIFINVPNASR